MEKISILQSNMPKEISVIRYYELNNNSYFIFSDEEIDESGFIKLYANKINNNAGVLSAINIVDENEWTNVKETIKNIIKANNEGRKAVKDLNHNLLANIAISDSRVFKLNKQLSDILASNKDIEEEGASAFVDPLQMVQPEPILPTMPEPQPTVEVQPTAPYGMQEQSMAQPTPTDVFGGMVQPIPTQVPVEAQPIPTQVPMEPQPVSQPYGGGMTMEPPTESSTEDYKALYEAEKERVQGLTIELTDLKTKLDSIKNMLD